MIAMEDELSTLADFEREIHSIDEWISRVKSLRTPRPPTPDLLQRLANAVEKQGDQLSEAGRLLDWPGVVALVNDVDTRFDVLSPDFYKFVLDQLPLQTVGNVHKQHACMLVLLARMCQSADFVLTAEQKADFLLDTNLYAYLNHVLGVYSDSLAVLDHVLWLPYISQELTAPRQETDSVAQSEYLLFCRAFCQQTVSSLAAGGGVKRPLLQTLSRVLVHWLSAFSSVESLLEDVLSAVRSLLLLVVMQPTDGLLRFLPVVAVLLEKHCDNQALVQLISEVFLAMDRCVLKAVCSVSQPVPVETFLKVSSASQSVTAYRAALRLCAIPSVAIKLTKDTALCKLALGDLCLELIEDIDSFGALDVAYALRPLVLTASVHKSASWVFTIATVELLLVSHAANENVLLPLVSALALVVSVPVFGGLQSVFNAETKLLDDPAWAVPWGRAPLQLPNPSELLSSVLEGYMASSRSRELSVYVLVVVNGLVVQCDAEQKHLILVDGRLEEALYHLCRGLKGPAKCFPETGNWSLLLLRLLVNLIAVSSRQLLVAVQGGWVKLLVKIGSLDEEPPELGPMYSLHCVEILGRLSGLAGKSKEAMLEGGAHVFYIHHMAATTDVTMSVRACQSLCVMLASNRIKHCAIEAGAIQALLPVLTRFHFHPLVVRLALLCLAGLALTDKPDKEKLLEQNVHQVMHTILNSREHSTMIHTLALVVLLRLLIDDGDTNQIAAIPGVQETVLVAVDCRSLLLLDSTCSDLVQCGHSLLANIFCTTVFRRLLPAAAQRRDQVFQLSLYSSALAKYLASDDGSVLPPFERSARPLLCTRLSGVALHTCPNCRSGLASEMILTFPSLAPADYEALAELGWFRRGGIQFFQFRSDHASPCNTGEVRVRVKEFNPAASRAYARVRRRCAAAGVQVKTIKPTFEQASFDLYYKYQVDRHDAEFCSRQTYQSHLLQTPLQHTMSDDGVVEYGTYHHQYWVGDHLAGVSVLDILPHSLNSIYMFFDVDKKYSRLSLGVYSCLRELELAQELNRKGADIRYYYLGNFCPSNRKLAYKADYQPAEVLCAHVSTDWSPHTRDSPSPLFDPVQPHNPLQEIVIKQALANGTADINYIDSPETDTMRCVYALPPEKQKQVNNVSSPYLRFLAKHADRERCSSEIERLCVTVDATEMSFGTLLRTYYMHPHCVGRLCWTLEELLAGLGKELFERLIIRMNVLPGSAMQSACSTDLV